MRPGYLQDRHHPLRAAQRKPYTPAPIPRYTTYAPRYSIPPATLTVDTSTLNTPRVIGFTGASTTALTSQTCFGAVNDLKATTTCLQSKGHQAPCTATMSDDICGPPRQAGTSVPVKESLVSGNPVYRQSTGHGPYILVMPTKIALNVLQKQTENRWFQGPGEFTRQYQVDGWVALAKNGRPVELLSADLTTPDRISTPKRFQSYWLVVSLLATALLKYLWF